MKETVYIKDYTPDAFTPLAYDESYNKLRQWIDDSLDVFKTELKEILFPIFQHCYLDLIGKGMTAESKQFFDTYKIDHITFNANDLQHLESITNPQNLQDNQYAKIHRSNKYTVPMTRTTFQLLISYIEDNGFVVLLRILNQYVNIDMHFQSKSAKSTGDAVGVVGIKSSIHEFNKQSIDLASRPINASDRSIIESALEREDEKMGTNATKENSYVSLFRKLHPMQDTSDISSVSGPLPPIQHKQVQEYIDQVHDLANRASLNSVTLPSICMYTWHNTYDALTTATVSSDATLAAAGFADSVIRVHSLTDAPLRSVVAPPPGIAPDSLKEWTVEQLDGLREPLGEPCKRLIGHQGSVYGVVFSPDKSWLISCSEDHTARLWSLQTFENVACYRGHNFPVWDVDIGPEGHYFATASHDRTARLWSSEYIFPLRIFAGHLSDVVKFHPNSNYIATGSSDKTVRVWDINTGMCVRVLAGHTGPIQALAFSPDGRFLATAGDDKNVHLFDINDGRRVKKMSISEKSVVSTLTFSQEGTLLASGSLDGSVRVWDVLRKHDEDTGSEVVMSDHAGAKKKRRTKSSSNDLLETFYTLQTPVVNLTFTRRNLLLATGPYNASTPIV